MTERQKPGKYLILKDTREQKGYFFTPYQDCLGMQERKLDTGDYTIEHLEDKVCIERKASPEEIAINLGQQKRTFLREVDRMKGFDHKFLILEFSVEDLLAFPKKSRIPTKQQKEYKVKITGKYLMKMLMEFQLHENIHVIFCGDKHNAFLTVCSLLKRINERYTSGRKK